MNEILGEDRAAISDLAFYMLREAYTATMQSFMRHDRAAAHELVEAIEHILTSAVQAIHSAEAEGPRSREIALALGSRLVGVFDQAHREPPAIAAPETPTPAKADVIAGRQAFAFFATLKAA